MIEMSEFSPQHTVGVGTKLTVNWDLEIILATVLSKMYFRPTDDEVVWNLSQIISPSIRRPSAKSGGGKGSFADEESKGLPLVSILNDLTI